MKPRLLVYVLGLLCCVGCGANSRSPSGTQFVHEATEAPGAEQAKQVARADGRARMAGEDKPGGAPQEAPAKSLPRKIIFNADVHLIVEDLTRASQDLRFLMKEHDAFVANSESGSTGGAPLQAFWRVRVPVERFDSFLEGLLKLGVPQRNKTDSQDVSEEYYDLQGRIKNKEVEQERLRTYLQDKKAVGRLDEILAIERELSRVNGEIEQLEGRLRRLKDLSALATVSVTMQQIKDYVPPQEPTFGNQISTTWNNSVESVSAFGRGVLLVLVALAPWLPVLAVVAVPLWLLLRRALPRWRTALGLASPPVLEAVDVEPLNAAAPHRHPDNPPKP